LVFLYFIILGWAAFGGVIIMVLLIPTQILISRVQAKLRKRILEFTDSRIKSINEILQGIKIIKFFTWENSFLEKVTSIRHNETIQFVKTVFLSSFTSAIMSVNIYNKIRDHQY
jgi:ABC-type multidrug transport system fused ATPase/permease subunit